MIMAEANWSELPRELLNLISQRLDDNDIDLIRFRSVCSNWRRSFSNHHHHSLPFKLHHFISEYPLCSLYKHILLLIKPPPPQQNQNQDHETDLHPWLIRISKNSRGETQLFHPFLDNPSVYRLPYDLDFNKLSFIHLGNHFVMYNCRIESAELQGPMPFGYGFGKKVVAVTCHMKNPLALGTLNRDGNLILFNCREQGWKTIPYMSSVFQDICVFKGRFCVVNKIGRTVAFGPDYSDQLVAEYVVDGGDMKFLVESEGELLLVDIYDRHCFGYPGEDGLMLNVFRLDEKKKRWVKLTNLGDRVLFLGNGCSFSTSLAKGGNCVIFIDNAFLPSDDMHCGMCVFHLDHGRLSRLSDNPHFLNLFWPPPDWIVNCSNSSSTSEVDNEICRSFEENVNLF